MPVDVFRIDDRLIHGQVVVGWGQPLNLRFVVLVDDDVAACDWERELYRMGVPPNVEVYFETVEGAAAHFVQYANDRRHGMLLTRDIDGMTRLVASVPAIHAINVGGVHFREGRRQRLRYLFLAEDEEQKLRRLAARGVSVTAQDVPTTRPVPLEEILSPGNGTSSGGYSRDDGADEI